jgi:hypothetical protein
MLESSKQRGKAESSVSFDRVSHLIDSIDRHTRKTNRGRFVHSNESGFLNLAGGFFPL